MGLPQDLHQSIERLTAYVQNAERQVEKGAIVELGMLEETVDTLCNSVQSLEGPAAQLLKPQVAELVSSLDSLAVSLQDFIAQKQKEIEEHG
ncbi:MAG: hypothetical protein AAF204_01665 [Pseudomonadota bacterium]